MLLGAGTVTNPNQVEVAAAAGATYIISPDCQKEVIERTKELGLVSMPGGVFPPQRSAPLIDGALIL